MFKKTLIAISLLAIFSIQAAPFLNGGFETASNTPNTKSIFIRIAENWEAILQAGASEVSADLSDDAHSGNKAFKLTAKAEKAFVGVYQEFDCEPDSEIKISAWMKAGGKTCAGFFRIYFIEKDGKARKGYLMPGWNLANKWTLCEYPFRVPKDISKIKLGIETLSNRFPNAELYIDDVAVIEKAGPVLQNSAVRAEIDPLFGGCIRSLEYSVNGDTFQFTLPRSMNDTGGIALEIIPGIRLPGMFANKKYDLSVLEPSRKILVSRTEKGGELDGLQVNKTYSLDKESSKIKVELEFVNTSSKDIATTCRVQNVITASDGFFTSPTRDWLQAFHKTDESLITTNAIDSNNLQFGWLAKSTPSAAIVFEFNLSHVLSGYSWISKELDTIEWNYMPLKLAPGEPCKTTYSINLAASNNPVFAFDGKAVYGVDALDAGKSSCMSITAIEPITTKVLVNSKELTINLKNSEKTNCQFESGNVKYESPDFHTAYGSKHNYKAEFIRGIKLPAPEGVSHTSRFDDFFMFASNDVSLTWREATGVNGYANQFIRNAEIAMRENAANNFNLFMIGRIIQPAILPQANLPDGKNLFGELAIKYDMSLASNTLIYRKTDVDVEQYRPYLQKMLDYFYNKDYLDFIKKYDQQFKAVYTADETTAPIIPSMLEAHETLAKRLPVDLPAFPYLNIHTRAYIPYVPIFFGDWYPINRKSHGGRNPWSTGQVTAETVAIAKDTPVHVILQCFGYFKQSYAFPTPSEIRMMSHLSVANGAKGISFHEVHNRGLSWRYNYGYHYAARGNAGELTPIWFTLGECARELTAIGPQVLKSSPAATPEWIKVDSPHYKSSNGYYVGKQVKVYTLAKPDATIIAVAINHSEKSAAEVAASFAPPSGKKVYSLSKMQYAGENYQLKLQPGDAEYFVIASVPELIRITNEVALSRFTRAKVVFRIAADRASGNGVKLTEAFKLEQEAQAAAAKKDGHTALTKIIEAEKAMNQRVGASEYGKFNDEWNKTRMTLSDISFMFLTHFDFVIPPHLRAKTENYARWNNTDDPVMQKLVDAVADCWTEYWQIEHEIVNGRLANEKIKAEALVKKAASDAKTASDYLKANAHKIKVDDPYTK